MFINEKMADTDAIVDVEQSPQDSASDQLKFQDFSDDHSLLQDVGDEETIGKQTHTFDDYPSDDDGDNTELLSGQKKQPSFWTFEYYQQFFDVDTSQVLWRLLGSFTPKPGKNFLQSQLRPSPDLYGPFWVCATLVFTIAISGDLADFFVHKLDPEFHWKAHFGNVTVGGVVIYTYASLIPALLYGVLFYRGNTGGYTFLELACLYGYSLTIYIPISLFCAFGNEALDWTLIILGLVLSSSVLLLALWPAVRDDERKISIVILVIVFLFHAALAIGFKLYFFHQGHQITTPSTTVHPVTKVAPTLSSPKQNQSGVLSV